MNFFELLELLSSSNVKTIYDNDKLRLRPLSGVLPEVVKIAAIQWAEKLKEKIKAYPDLLEGYSLYKFLVSNGVKFVLDGKNLKVKPGDFVFNVETKMKVAHHKAVLISLLMEIGQDEDPFVMASVPEMYRYFFPKIMGVDNTYCSVLFEVKGLMDETVLESKIRESLNQALLGLKKFKFVDERLHVGGDRLRLKFNRLSIPSSCLNIDVGRMSFNDFFYGSQIDFSLNGFHFMVTFVKGESFSGFLVSSSLLNFDLDHLYEKFKSSFLSLDAVGFNNEKESDDSFSKLDQDLPKIEQLRDYLRSSRLFKSDVLFRCFNNESLDTQFGLSPINFSKLKGLCERYNVGLMSVCSGVFAIAICQCMRIENVRVFLNLRKKRFISYTGPYFDYLPINVNFGNSTSFLSLVESICHDHEFVGSSAIFTNIELPEVLEVGHNPFDFSFFSFAVSLFSDPSESQGLKVVNVFQNVSRWPMHLCLLSGESLVFKFFYTFNSSFNGFVEKLVESTQEIILGLIKHACWEKCLLGTILSSFGKEGPVDLVEDEYISFDRYEEMSLVEKSISHIYSTAVGHKVVTSKDNFFELGGSLDQLFSCYEQFPSIVRNVLTPYDLINSASAFNLYQLLVSKISFNPFLHCQSSCLDKTLSLEVWDDYFENSIVIVGSLSNVGASDSNIGVINSEPVAFDSSLMGLTQREFDSLSGLNQLVLSQLYYLLVSVIPSCSFLSSKIGIVFCHDFSVNHSSKDSFSDDHSYDENLVSLMISRFVKNNLAASLVQSGELSFISALYLADCWLKSGKCDTVFVSVCQSLLSIHGSDPEENCGRDIVCTFAIKKIVDAQKNKNSIRLVLQNVSVEFLNVSGSCYQSPQSLDFPFNGFNDVRGFESFGIAKSAFVFHCLGNFNNFSPGVRFNQIFGRFFHDKKIENLGNLLNVKIQFGDSLGYFANLNCLVDVNKNNRSQECSIFIVSGPSEEYVYEYLGRVSEILLENPGLNLQDLCYTMSIKDEHNQFRKFFVVQNVFEFFLMCGNLSKEASFFSGYVNHPKVAFMFPGQGVQYMGMGRNLYDVDPLFRKYFQKCLEILKTISPAVYNIFSNPHDDGGESYYRLTMFIQPVLFILEYSLSMRLISLGITPDYMIGNSLGEFVAATISGIFSLEDAIFIVCKRGELMQKIPEGSQLSVNLNEKILDQYLNCDLSIAGIAGPSQTMVAGTRQAIDALKMTLESRSISCQRLFTSHAFHSFMMDSIIPEFEDLVSKINLNTPKIPIISTITGTWITDEEARSPHFWAMQLRLPVRFSQGLEFLFSLDQKINILEVGPDKQLTTFAIRHPQKNSGHTIISTMRQHHETKNDWYHFLVSLGRVWTAGTPVDWKSLYSEEGRRLEVFPITISKNDLVYNGSKLNRNISTGSNGMNYVEPRDDFEVELTKFWADAFKIQKIGIFDDFFELGGNSLIAARLVNQLRRKMKIPLSHYVIFQKKTIAELAEFVKDLKAIKSRSSNRAAILIQLNEGKSNVTPLFVFHPIEGDILIYRQLVGYLGVNQPVIGFQARSLVGGEVYTNLKVQAAAYISIIKEYQSSGPYQLCGFSYGGLLAYEISQQLLASGDSVSLTVLIDSAHPSTVDLDCKDPVDILSFLIGYSVVFPRDEYFNLTDFEKIQYLENKLKSLNKSNIIPPVFGSEMCNTWIGHQAAIKCYEPDKYPGKVVFFRATKAMGSVESNGYLPWIELVENGFELHQIQGDHLALMTQSHLANSIAKKIKSHLNRN